MYFLRKVNIFPIKKQSFCRKLFFEVEYPGRGGVEAWRIAKNFDDFTKKLIPNFVLPWFDM
jgi:hypothetical protein